MERAGTSVGPLLAQDVSPVGKWSHGLGRPPLTSLAVAQLALDAQDGLRVGHGAAGNLRLRVSLRPGVRLRLHLRHNTIPLALHTLSGKVAELRTFVEISDLYTTQVLFFSFFLNDCWLSLNDFLIKLQLNNALKILAKL